MPCKQAEPTNLFNQTTGVLCQLFRQQAALNIEVSMEIYWISNISHHYSEVVETKVDYRGFRRFFNSLIKCCSLVSNRQTSPLIDNPDVICMLLAKLPTYIQDRWNKMVYSISHTEGREGHLPELIDLVDKETVWENDPFFHVMLWVNIQVNLTNMTEHIEGKSCRLTWLKPKKDQNQWSVQPVPRIMILKVVRYTLTNLWRIEVNLSTRANSVMDASVPLLRISMQKTVKIEEAARNVTKNS